MLVWIILGAYAGFLSLVVMGLGTRSAKQGARLARLEEEMGEIRRQRELTAIQDIRTRLYPKRDHVGRIIETEPTR